MHPCTANDVFSSLKTTGRPIRVSGGTPAVAALLVSQYSFCSDNASIVILCQNDDAAVEFVTDLESLSGLNDTKESLAIHHFPTWESPVHSPIALSLRTRLQRVAVLSSLVSSTKKKIIVTSIQAACQLTMPISMFLDRSIRLNISDVVESRNALLSSLQDLGYARIDPVEDPGSFVSRGEIVDVFPPGRSKPLRIELFDTMIERIREFDPTTQRTTNNVDEQIEQITISPAREVIINTHTAQCLREKVKELADNSGISRSIRDPLLESIQNGIYPDHCDAWAPLAYKNPSTFWDYLTNPWLVVWNDEPTCLHALDDFKKINLTPPTEKSGSSVVVPPGDYLFRFSKSDLSHIYEKTTLFLDRLDLMTPQEINALNLSTSSFNDRHHILTEPNNDLATGTKRSLGDLEPKLRSWLKSGFKIAAFASTSSQLERMRFLFEERGLPVKQDGKPQPLFISLHRGLLSSGFKWPAEGLVVLTDAEILGKKKNTLNTRYKSTGRSSALKSWSGLNILSDLSIGDAVVHIDHGIGIYQGLIRLDISGAPSDFLMLEYANKDKLYLPVYRLNTIQKYIGSGQSAPLDRLGNQHFTKAKEKVRGAVKKLAVDLIQLYAERQIRKGFQHSQRDAFFSEFEAKFIFDETDDQLAAVDDILSDLASGRIMDRLVCGDVGYGKTEVAIRAAFRAVTDGKQVAVLVPTTVLAFQHEQSFKTRLTDYPITIDSISRFKSLKEQKSTALALAAGKIDIIVGTHRLLSRDIKFSDLGLIIIDEEHRFGVEHKEKLKTLRANTHVLTLTATPIPRTLHMTLAGLRDISLINTPPVDRLPIRTFVSRFDETIIKQAVGFELTRGGQLFFLHNRVQSIHETADKLRTLVKNARIAVAHGQMPDGELEKTMVDFYQKKTDVLVCTTIIESGLDIPSANTIIINRADMLGLSQLYQIRGRVGRGQYRAYAYLLIPAEGDLTEEAKQRLEIIQRFVELGSGFSIANHDLEIRGGGDLLGPLQSGHISAVGFDLYTELLEEAVREIQGKPMLPQESSREPEIKAPFPSFLDEQYVPDVHQRLSFYRRLSSSVDESSLEKLEAELIDRFGPLPTAAQNLLWIIRIKQLLKKAGIDCLTVGEGKISLTSGPISNLNPERAVALVATDPKKYQLISGSKLLSRMDTSNIRDLFFNLEDLMNRLIL